MHPSQWTSTHPDPRLFAQAPPASQQKQSTSPHLPSKQPTTGAPQIPQPQALRTGPPPAVERSLTGAPAPHAPLQPSHWGLSSFRIETAETAAAMALATATGGGVQPQTAAQIASHQRQMTGGERSVTSRAATEKKVEETIYMRAMKEQSAAIRALQDALREEMVAVKELLRVDAEKQERRMEAAEVRLAEMETAAKKETAELRELLKEAQRQREDVEKNLSALNDAFTEAVGDLGKQTGASAERQEKLETALDSLQKKVESLVSEVSADREAAAASLAASEERAGGRHEKLQTFVEALDGKASELQKQQHVTETRVDELTIGHQFIFRASELGVKEAKEECADTRRHVQTIANALDSKIGMLEESRRREEQNADTTQAQVEGLHEALTSLSTEVFLLKAKTSVESFTSRAGGGGGAVGAGGELPAGEREKEREGPFMIEQSLHNRVPSGGTADEGGSGKRDAEGAGRFLQGSVGGGGTVTGTDRTSAARGTAVVHTIGDLLQSHSVGTLSHQQGLDSGGQGGCSVRSGEVESGTHRRASAASGVMPPGASPSGPGGVGGGSMGASSDRGAGVDGQKSWGWSGEMRLGGGGGSVPAGSASGVTAAAGGESSGTLQRVPSGGGQGAGSGHPEVGGAGGPWRGSVLRDVAAAPVGRVVGTGSPGTLMRPPHGHPHLPVFLRPPPPQAHGRRRDHPLSVSPPRFLPIDPSTPRLLLPGGHRGGPLLSVASLSAIPPPSAGPQGAFLKFHPHMHSHHLPVRGVSLPPSASASPLPSGSRVQHHPVKSIQSDSVRNAAGGVS
uniref:Uncharacterized protein n=1 Tax=Chromera velia CCMP2878 TaxID=1169474 RepID=A0A0G4GFA4_9ALVE|eukprot:Cvel_21615.t1-p1 / transcript=Cvel_21615.t1 / gene=Cvel_21615 / organism=Chromera_velia_CCMP2878 / gene_product=hypothetical protein / transcript_product=hypothetical protein / location=Cvel_scaffold2042:17299-23594(+) / protein_length=796 / sequence_SO=supercontig / SO=protein_coding / is_pseudo=false